MSGMNQATHDYIVFKLGQALQMLLLAQATTAVRKGHKNFDMAIGFVHECEKIFGGTWEATRDPNTAMPALESAKAKLILVHAGEAATSVGAALRLAQQHFGASPAPSRCVQPVSARCDAQGRRIRP